MLVLSRKQNQAIVIDGNIRITVTSIRGNQVRLGIEAPAAVAIFREELCGSSPANEESPQPARAGGEGACAAVGSNDTLRRATLRPKPKDVRINVTP